MSLIYSILAFLLVIGILVTVHEFGHYWVAKQLGVKILRFSIGFGQTLWMRCFGRDRTEFVIAAIPLGGYVKMLDENEEEVPPADLPRAFNRQSLKVRTAIVVAGPLFNFLFAIIAYTAMYLLGVTGMKAIVGEITPQTAAERANLSTGEQIIAVAGLATPRWDSVVHVTLQQLLDGHTKVVYTVQDSKGYQYSKTLEVTDVTIDDIAEGNFFENLGFRPLRPPPPAIIGSIKTDSAAERAKLQAGDKILQLDETPITDWNAWADYITQRPQKEIRAQVEREGQIISLTIVPDNIEGEGRMGVYSVSQYEIPLAYQITEHYGLGTALWKGIEKTYEISVLTLRIMYKMLTLQVSAQHISGPISIAQFAGESAQNGLVVFLSFLGLVSVSLAVINLLPIPILDGGHLLLYLIEWIKGSPVTDNTAQIMQRVGMTFIFGLMGLAIFNDIWRLLH